MKIDTSVSVTYSKETVHRTAIQLRANRTSRTESPVEFDIPQGHSPFDYLIQLAGVVRYHKAWSTALERCDVRPIGSIELDDDDFAKLARYRVAI